MADREIEVNNRTYVNTMLFADDQLIVQNKERELHNSLFQLQVCV